MKCKIAEQIVSNARNFTLPFAYLLTKGGIAETLGHLMIFTATCRIDPTIQNKYQHGTHHTTIIISD